MQERPDIANSTLTAMMSVKWKVNTLNSKSLIFSLLFRLNQVSLNICILLVQELSDEEKQIWNDKAAGVMAAYKREMEEYNKSIAAGAS